VSLYRPSLDWSNPQPPILRLRQLDLNETISGNNQVVIEYAALSFVNEQRVRYRTRLIGYDTSWSDVTNDTRIRYTNLKAVLLPRQYTLEVMAANDAGVWTEEPLTVSFSIQPAWWLTWWAGALYVLVLAGVAVAVDSIRNLRLKRRTVELGEQVERRTAEIRSHIQELETLDEIVATINREKSLEKVMETLLEQGLVLLPQASQGAFILRDEQRHLFEVVAVYGWDRDELFGVWFSVDEALSRYVEGTDKLASGVYVVSDGTHRPGADKVQHLSSSDRMLTIDLPIGGKIFGLLVFELITPLESLRANDVRKLIRYRQHAISALDRALVFRQLEHKSREAEQANRAKSAFLANMSHELRTPLNSIIGFSEVLLHKLREDADERAAKFLSNILASGHHLLALINDLLDLSKIEAGKMELELERVSIEQLVHGVTAVIHGIAKKRGVVVEQQLDPEADSAYLDASKVKQILYNLLSNAIKFSPDESTVTVRSCSLDAEASPLNEPTVVLEVADRGIGIPVAEQHRIFEEFQQLDDSSSRQYVGTGLGLALVRRYIEMMGGTIELESTVDVGSTFRVLLPVDASGGSERS
jgi:signal transduction histidine kinase